MVEGLTIPSLNEDSTTNEYALEFNLNEKSTPTSMVELLCNKVFDRVADVSDLAF